MDETILLLFESRYQAESVNQIHQTPPRFDLHLFVRLTTAKRTDTWLLTAPDMDQFVGEKKTDRIPMKIIYLSTTIVTIRFVSAVPIDPTGLLGQPTIVGHMHRRGGGFAFNQFPLHDHLMVSESISNRQGNRSVMYVNRFPPICVMRLMGGGCADSGR